MLPLALPPVNPNNVQSSPLPKATGIVLSTSAMSFQHQPWFFRHLPESRQCPFQPHLPSVGPMKMRQFLALSIVTCAHVSMMYRSQSWGWHMHALRGG